MGSFWRGRAALAQWVRGGLTVAVVMLMAAVSSGMLGTPAWATVAGPNSPIRQGLSPFADNIIIDNDSPDNDDALPGTPGETTLTVVGCPGTMFIRVRSLTGFAPGNMVRINPGGSTQEDVRLADVGCGGPFLHLTGALQYRHQAGETVIVVGQSQASSISQPGDDRERSQPERRTEEQRLQAEQTNRSGRDDYHTEGDVAEVDFSKQPPEIVILTRDGRQTVQLLCGDQCPAISPGDYVEVDGVKENEGLFQAETVTVTSR